MALGGAGTLLCMGLLSLRTKPAVPRFIIKE
jgi:hypothetical protein